MQNHSYIEDGFTYCHLGFSSKIEMPKLDMALLCLELFQLGSIRLGKFQLELITIVHYPNSNQIYLVTFMCLTVDTSFIFTKKSIVAKWFFDICKAEMAQCRQKKHEIWTFKVNFLCQKTSESF